MKAYLSYQLLYVRLLSCDAVMQGVECSFVFFLCVYVCSGVLHSGGATNHMTACLISVIMEQGTMSSLVEQARMLHQVVGSAHLF